MNVTLTESGYTLDGKWRLVPVEPTYEMAILSLNGGLDYKLGVKAAPPPPQQSPWQPIATAPKDGSEFIAIDKLAVCPTPFVVCWTDTFQCFVVGGDSVMSLVLDDALHMDDTCSIDATHWMPLPEPAP
jgi:hypothetical protein